MSSIVRLGDKVSCGSICAQGSGNVFANGMPIVNSARKKTTGHGSFPPSELVGPWARTVFVNGNPVGLKGKTKMAVHRHKKSSHDGIVVTGSGNVFIE